MWNLRKKSSNERMDSCISIYYNKCPYNDVSSRSTKSTIKEYQPDTHQLIKLSINLNIGLKLVSEYDQEIPESQTADKPMAPRGRATQQSRDTRKTN